jgi:hypothetical protein
LVLRSIRWATIAVTKKVVSVFVRFRRSRPQLLVLSVLLVLGHGADGVRFIRDQNNKSMWVHTHYDLMQPIYWKDEANVPIITILLC